MHNAASNRLVLVTGGAGYKGSTLCRELLSRGYKVRVMDCLLYGGRSIAVLLNHPDFEFTKGDITNPRDVNNAFDGVTDVVHLAAIVGDRPCERDPKLAVNINYKATQLLADAARKKGINRFIFASTCGAYGVTDTAYLANEERELNPASLYAETKIDCERYLLELGRTSGLTPVILRFGTAYGVSGRTRFDLTVNSFTYEAMRDKKIIVFSQESWRPFTHVLDMARIYIAALNAPKEALCGGIFNAGWNRHNYMKKEIVKAIREVVGNFEIDYVNTIDKRSYRVDFSRIETALKLTSAVSLKDGIEEIAQAVRSNLLTEQDFEMNRLK